MKKYYIENNRYCTKIYIGTDGNGKPKYKKLKAKTERELDKRVLEFKKTLGEGIDVKKGSDTLKIWSISYLESLKSEVECDNLTESEYKTVKFRLEFFLNFNGGILANTRLNDILPSHIQPAINSLYKENPATGKKTAKKTINNYIQVLANVFEFARKQRAYKFSNPCNDVHPPKNAETKKRTAINLYTISLILSTEHRAKLAANIMLLAGLRRGELTALTWSDVNFSKKTICISKSYDFKNHKLKSTKTEAGIREIHISDYLINILKEAKNESTGKYVIEKVYGGRMTETAWKRLFESYMIALRKSDEERENTGNECFKEFTIHQLRHTYCSMLQWSGVDIKTAQELMGHSDYSVTANVYTHVNSDVKIQAALLQDKFIKEFLA